MVKHKKGLKDGAEPCCRCDGTAAGGKRPLLGMPSHLKNEFTYEKKLLRKFPIIKAAIMTRRYVPCFSCEEGIDERSTDQSTDRKLHFLLNSEH